MADPRIAALADQVSTLSGQQKKQVALIQQLSKLLMIQQLEANEPLLQQQKAAIEAIPSAILNVIKSPPSIPGNHIARTLASMASLNYRQSAANVMKLTCPHIAIEFLEEAPDYDIKTRTVPGEEEINDMALKLKFKKIQLPNIKALPAIQLCLDHIKTRINSLKQEIIGTPVPPL